VTDYIEGLKGEILTAFPDTSPLWAEYNSLITLSTALPHAKIKTKRGQLKLNFIILGIGIPGIVKSLPLSGFTWPILKRFGERIGMDVILPNRSSVEGFIGYVSEKDGEKLKHPFGAIIRDEFSGAFQQMRNAGWQSDGMEFVSEMYDNIFQKRATLSHGLHYIEEMYSNLISCSTYHFIGCMDAQFFTQGTGNRFLYDHLDIKKLNVNKDKKDVYEEIWAESRPKIHNNYSEMLANVYESKVGYDGMFVNTSDEASSLLNDFKYKKDLEWKKRALDDPYGWDYHYLRRQYEFTLKLAGLYSVSEIADRILTIPTKYRDKSIIGKQHVERAIALVEQSNDKFKEIVRIKRETVEQEKPTSKKELARSMLPSLARSKDMILTTTQWFDQIDTITNPNKKEELKKICLVNGWIEIIPTTLEIRTKLGIPPAARNLKVCKYVKGL